MGYVTPRIEIVCPSFRAVSPLLIFLSTGPHPFVAEFHARSLTYIVDVAAEVETLIVAVFVTEPSDAEI